MSDGRIVDYHTAVDWFYEGYDEHVIAYMPVPKLPECDEGE
jgi:hypothetical protein